MSYQFNPPNKVYHATLFKHFESIQNNVLIENLEITYNADFGRGFYTTTNKIQAVQRARDIQKKFTKPGEKVTKQNRGIIISFDLNQDLLYTLGKYRYKVFDSINEDWARFIVKNRLWNSKVGLSHSYYWTYGGMADGSSLMRLCKMYYEGRLNLNDLLYGFDEDGEYQNGIQPFRNNYNQLVFHKEHFANQVLLNPQYDLYRERNVIKQKG
ncbi:DUF3990 domain-containing protein [Gracilibacillus timonensis]|uniref:DUF3990 domain-containing protein n=1 Tax=Gracilibacillus timonensis TaxID=1816696 RepID=UPI0008240014|nr:DUF3990 domain-containing protein [Gracilibacillus timonensis]